MSTKIILEVPDSFPVVELYAAISQLGCILKVSGNGELIGCQDINPERHGNATVLRFPKRKRQIFDAELPTGPEAA